MQFFFPGALGLNDPVRVDTRSTGAPNADATVVAVHIHEGRKL